ncbi:hypothetical protein RJT34_17630 [Clitoria ternatea]|uniref:BHLH domain-containing protein n=1 Tax=Clitoria ternatea TaxID=43366 RepID=A0AAN9J9A9_CLITE
MECINPSSGSSSSKEKKSSSSISSVRKSKRVVKLSTDPQSVAARERRHRISDRFKILQSMVPGGSKMDTVSMLEEAIHYVKFLKTQIWLHQTIIDFHHPSDSPLFLPPEHNFSTLQQNPSLLLDFSQQCTLPQLPYFQGEQVNPFDANMEYWPA